MPVFRSPKKGLSYSQAIAEAYASAPEDVVIMDTLEFRHPTFIDPDTLEVIALRVVNDHEALDATLEDTAPMDAGEVVTFQPVRFGFRRPAESESGSTQEVEITVSNVSKTMMPYLDRAKETRIPIEVTYRPYLSDDTSGPHMNPPMTLTLRNVTTNMSDVSARAGFGDLTNRRWPRVDYTPARFPGLVAK